MWNGVCWKVSGTNIPKGIGNYKNVNVGTWTLKRGEIVELVNIRQGRQYQIIVPGQSLLLSAKNQNLLWQQKLSIGKQADAFLPLSCLHKRIMSITDLCDESICHDILHWHLALKLEEGLCLDYLYFDFSYSMINCEQLKLKPLEQWWHTGGLASCLGTPVISIVLLF